METKQLESNAEDGRPQQLTIVDGDATEVVLNLGRMAKVANLYRSQIV